MLFSNDRAEVGTRPGVEDELEEALDGELESEISDLTAGENTSERVLADELFETYVPFRFDGEEHVSAASSRSTRTTR